MYICVSKRILTKEDKIQVLKQNIPTVRELMSSLLSWNSQPREEAMCF